VFQNIKPLNYKGLNGKKLTIVFSQDGEYSLLMGVDESGKIYVLNEFFRGEKMKEKINGIKEFLGYMTFDYATSEMTVSDTMRWAENVLNTFDELIKISSY
jgi:hypothetical protein